ncbi:MAG: hypothetical protein ACD_46C00463G0008 [uncultured bacterium]|nr:MAG: hypothetical protein ACD_46C00463G0008 [uncultured bacterium]
MYPNSIFYSIRNEIKETLSIGIPMISSQIIYASSGFLGTAMVAQLGENALAASVLVSSIWMSLSVLFFGILNSVCVLVAHQYGAKNEAAISKIMGQAFILAGILCVIMLGILSSMPLFLHWSNQPPAVLSLARSYMTSLLWTVPGLLTLITIEQFLAGINRAKIVLRISLLVVPIEVPLIYMLIFGKFGLPACGVAGVGYGFAITYTGTAICMLIHLNKSHFYQRFGIFKAVNTINFAYLGELFRVGLPMGLMNVIELSTFAFATFWIARFGTTFLAAHQIIMQYLGFAITLVFAMSQAVTVRVGHAVGEQNLMRVHYASYVGMGLNFIAVSIISLGFYFIPTFFLHLDMNILDPKNAPLIRDASSLLSICAALLIFDNFRIIGFGALRGLKETRFPMFASFFSFWVIGLSSAFLFGFTWQFGAKGIWWGLTFGIACGAVIVLLRLGMLLQTVDLSKILDSKITH